jgi:uncharacterized protein YutE (UPF0331/DUF86 family)
MESLRLVSVALRNDLLHVYGTVNSSDVYAPFMLAVSAAFVGLFVREARDVRRDSPAAPTR